MNNNWHRSSWGQIATLEYGKSLRKYKNCQGIVPVYGTNGQIGYTDIALCNSDGIIVGRKGANRGVHYSSKPFYVIDTAYYLKQKKDKVYDTKWAYYFLLTQNINSLDSGSAIPSTSRSDFYALPVILPPLSEQKAIAETLSCLDDKIELNNRINKTLEEMAQAIFKSWFVDFEPFLDGEFEDSELGPIPEGWSVVKLEDILSTLETGNRPKGGVGNLDNGIPSIGAENIIGLGQYDFSKEKYVPITYFEGMKKGIVHDWDVLLYKDGAQLGRKTMFACGFPHEKCCVNSHVFILRSNNLITQPYLFFWLDQDCMTQNIINLNANSAQPGINQSAVKQLKILVPDRKSLSKFQMAVKPLLEKVFENCKENRVLSTGRNFLIPKLMSGEIRTLSKGG